MPSTITPNMGLIVPTVGQEPGPNWASDLNADLGTLDQHNHSSGQGVQITPAGLNINTDLPMNSNNITQINTTRYQALGSPLSGISPNLGCMYVASNELYYNDEAGNTVKITNNGSVNAGAGSISGLPSGTASASYVGVSGTFVWESATNTAANMDFASAIFRDQTLSSNGVTVSPPNSIPSDYAITWPPQNTTGSTVLLTYDTSGNIGIGPATSTVSPSGSIVMYGGTSAPSGYLLCDGSSYLRTTYPDLFSAIGTAYGTADSTHFNVPDFRGIFPRGVDNGAGNDPDASSRTAANPGGNTGDNVGSYEPDDFLDHSHFYTNVNANPGVFAGVLGGAASNGFTTNSSTTTGGGSGSETRPKNLYVNFIIKT